MKGSKGRDAIFARDSAAGSDLRPTARSPLVFTYEPLHGTPLQSVTAWPPLELMRTAIKVRGGGEQQRGRRGASRNSDYSAAGSHQRPCKRNTRCLTGRDQNRSFSASCISRPPTRVLRMMPNCAVPAARFGSPNTGWLNALNNSARNCTFSGSREPSDT